MMRKQCCVLDVTNCDACQSCDHEVDLNSLALFETWLVKRWAQGQTLVCWHEGKTHGGKVKGDNSKPGLQVIGQW